MFIGRRTDAKFGFTIAEMVITLSIIGIVAMFTLQTIFAKYDKLVYVSQLKKFYVTFQSGMQNYMAGQGCTELTCTELFAPLPTGDVSQTGYNPKITLPKIFKLRKECALAGTYCARNAKALNPSDTWWHQIFDVYEPSYRMIDGAEFNFQKNLCRPMPNRPYNANTKVVCALVDVDVNGIKPPNREGRDIFEFFLSKDGLLYPLYGKEYAEAVGTYDRETNSYIVGDYKTSSHYWPNTSWCGKRDQVNDGSSYFGAGLYCAARIMENGWVMDY